MGLGVKDDEQNLLRAQQGLLGNKAGAAWRGICGRGSGVEVMKLETIKQLWLMVTQWKNLTIAYKRGPEVDGCYPVAIVDINSGRIWAVENSIQLARERQNASDWAMTNTFLKRVYVGEPIDYWFRDLPSKKDQIKARNPFS